MLLGVAFSRRLVAVGRRANLAPTVLAVPLQRRPFQIASFLAAQATADAKKTNNTSDTSVAPIKATVLHGAVPRLTLSLSNGEKYIFLWPSCVFPLHLHETVRDLVIDIREEDRSIREIIFLDENGLRIAHSTRLEDLVRSPFVIALDNRRFSVDARLDPTAQTSTVLGNSEIQDLTMKAYYKKIRERLVNADHHHMPYAEYLAWCSEFGLSEEQARELSRAMHLTGEILHFQDNEKLRDYIFLEPEIITNSVVDQLDLKYVKKNTNQLRHGLAEILPKYLKINAVKKELDAKAERSAKLSMWLGGGYLVAQFSVLAHMVWIDFNWDIMEPISYFVGLATMMVGVLFFSLYRTEYTYFALMERQRLKALRKLYISKEFNWERWNALDQKVKYYREQLGEANVPEELKRA